MRGCPTPRPQQKGMEEPIKDPRQEEKSDAAEGEVIANYSLDINNEGSEPEVEPDAQGQRDVDPDTEYVKMKMPRDGTLRQGMMPWETYMGILWEHKT